jgi:hypothetical protein
MDETKFKKGDKVIVNDMWVGTVDQVRWDTDGEPFYTVEDQDSDFYDLPEFEMELYAIEIEHSYTSHDIARKILAEPAFEVHVECTEDQVIIKKVN